MDFLVRLSWNQHYRWSQPQEIAQHHLLLLKYLKSMLSTDLAICRQAKGETSWQNVHRIRILEELLMWAKVQKLQV